jgi:hypothetical protein
VLEEEEEEEEDDEEEEYNNPMNAQGSFFQMKYWFLRIPFQD